MLPAGTALRVTEVCRTWRDACSDSYWRLRFLGDIGTPWHVFSLTWQQRYKYFTLRLPASSAALGSRNTLKNCRLDGPGRAW